MHRTRRVSTPTTHSTKCKTMISFERLRPTTARSTMCPPQRSFSKLTTNTTASRPSRNINSNSNTNKTSTSSNSSSRSIIKRSKSPPLLIISKKVRNQISMRIISMKRATTINMEMRSMIIRSSNSSSKFRRAIMRRLLKRPVISLLNQWRFKRKFRKKKLLLPKTIRVLLRLSNSRNK